MDISVLDFSSRSMIKNLHLILDLKEGEIMDFYLIVGGGGVFICFYTRVKYNKRGGGRENELVCILLRVT